MRGMFSQIVIGVIVTVVGTVIANSITRGGSHAAFFKPAFHASGPMRSGR